MDRQHLVATVFGATRALVGMIHLPALPGSPQARLSMEAITETAVADARIYHAAGFHAVMIENTHDRPYRKRAAGPETLAAMTVAGREVRRALGLPLGVQILAGANREAIAVAHACGAAFVRAEGFVFAHVADEGLIDSDAAELLRYRRAVGAEQVRIFADVKKKHSAHALTADVDLVETACAAEFFLVDGVIVTGVATGRAADPTEVAAVGEAVGIPTLVGSGVTAGNLAAYAAADGFIVGSSLKRDGVWSSPLDPARVEAFARAFAALSKSK